MRSNVRVMALSETHNDRDEDNKKQDTTPTSKAEADEIASVGRILSDLATLDLEPNVTDARCEIVKCICRTFNLKLEMNKLLEETKANARGLYLGCMRTNGDGDPKHVKHLADHGEPKKYRCIGDEYAIGDRYEGGGLMGEREIGRTRDRYRALLY
jgi:hypothetical protein